MNLVHLQTPHTTETEKGYKWNKALTSMIMRHFQGSSIFQPPHQTPIKADKPSEFHLHLVVSHGHLKQAVLCRARQLKHQGWFSGHGCMHEGCTLDLHWLLKSGSRSTEFHNRQRFQKGNFSFNRQPVHHPILGEKSLSPSSVRFT